jgi:hypothetical protein
MLAIIFLLAGCVWHHPPNMEKAQLIKARIEQIGKSWNLNVCVTYNDKKIKKWCSDFGKFPNIDEAWNTYKNWKLHIENVTHYAQQ